MLIKDIGEIGLINRLAGRARADKTVVKGIGDDAAVIKWTKDKYLLFTCDMLIEGVHFDLRKATPFQIGWKALARNISDIAAMGGMPKYALVSVGLDAKLPVRFADEIYRGLASIARIFRVNIVGGDTVKSGNLVIDVSLIGYVEKKNLVSRSGAKPGDVILVTGSIGGSIKGKHLNFVPRAAEARRLVKGFKVNSMIDISDGLLLDLQRILSASRAGARIYEDAVPVSGKAGSLSEAVRDGEDFELLFTMSAKEARRLLRTTSAKIAAPVTKIGEIVGRTYGLRLVRKDGSEERVKAEGYLHF